MELSRIRSIDVLPPDQISLRRRTRGSTLAFSVRVRTKVVGSSSALACAICVVVFVWAKRQTMSLWANSKAQHGLIVAALANVRDR